MKAIRLKKSVFQELQGLISTQEDRDDMAIPSYLHGNPLINWIFWKRHDAVLSLFPGQKLSRALDFGCGTGAFLPSLAKQADEIYGYDIRPAIARELVKKLNIANCTILGPDDFDTIPGNSLDAVVCADVLEHVPDLKQTSDMLRSKLRKKGIVIISGPTENLLYKLGRKIAGFTGDYHVRDVDEIFDVLKQRNFVQTGEKKLPVPLLPDNLSLFKIARFEV